MIASRSAEFRSNISTSSRKIVEIGSDLRTVPICAIAANCGERARFERESPLMRVLVARYCTLSLLTFSSPAWGDSGEMAPLPAEWGSEAAAVALVFDESAAALPQVDIRIAVERALGAPVALQPSPERPTLRVSLAADGTLLLTYQRPASTLERRLPNPLRSDQIPLLVGLAAVNLVRNQAADLTPRPEPPSSTEPAPPEPRAPPASAPSPEPTPEVKTRNAPASFRSWFGIHVGVDLVPLSASNACDIASRNNDHIRCFSPDGSTYLGTPSRGAAGNISGGLKAATVPVLLSFEHTFGSFGVEARAGYAFNGGPRPAGGAAFFPVRAELRGEFWPLGTNAPDLAFRPYLHLGAGLAQVDAQVHGVEIVDCTSAPPSQFDACRAASSPSEAQAFHGVQQTVTIVKSLGLVSFTAGGGTTFALADRHALVLEVNFLMLLPATGFALEPSIGYRIGI
jgi:hypothetical protein